MSEVEVGEISVAFLVGDLLQQAVDAIVNAANSDLRHGGGVAGAISRQGGSEIHAESDRIAPIPVGSAAITGAGRLPARYLLHAASMELGRRTSPNHLESAMDDCFRLAGEHGLTTLAVPAVGAGIGGLPLSECAQAMAAAVRRAAQLPAHPREIRFVLVDHRSAEAFEAAFRAALAG